MNGVNKVTLLGNLGNEPELRYTSTKQPVCNFRMATSQTWRDKNGEKQEKTEWHRIVAWGNTAVNCKEYLAKGAPVYLEGRLQTRQWEDRDGNKRYTTEIHVSGQVTFLPNPRRSQENSDIEYKPHDVDIPVDDFDGEDMPF